MYDFIIGPGGALVIQEKENFLTGLIRKIAGSIASYFGSDGTAQEQDNAKSASSEAAMQRVGEVMDKHGDRILRVAYSYLHNMEDAEDILQDTLIKYIQNSPSFNGPEHEKAWLITVASNLSKNKIKYNKVREADELSEELVSKDQEDLAFVWEAVKKLPEKYREVVHLFYQEGYATAEISRILGRKEATVRSDLLRARKQLKEILKEAYDFE